MNKTFESQLALVLDELFSCGWYKFIKDLLDRVEPTFSQYAKYKAMLDSAVLE